MFTLDYYPSERHESIFPCILDILTESVISGNQNSWHRREWVSVCTWVNGIHITLSAQSVLEKSYCQPWYVNSRNRTDATACMK